MRRILVLLTLLIASCGKNITSNVTITPTSFEDQSTNEALYTHTPEAATIKPIPGIIREPTATAPIKPSETPEDILGQLPENVVITYIDDQFYVPRGCDLGGVIRTLMNVTDAVNHGNWTEFYKLFDFLGDFEEIFADKMRLYKLPDVQRYFMQREQQQERWQPKQVMFFNDWIGIGLEYLFIRNAIDLPANTGVTANVFTAKIVMKCEKGNWTVVRWVMGPFPPEFGRIPKWCPDAPTSSSPDTVIACTEGWTEE